MGRANSHVEIPARVAYDDAMKKGMILLASFLCATALHAKVVFEKVEYQEGATVCEGLMVYDDALTGPRSGVLIAHQWKGLTDYEKMRGEMLARAGHVVLCADIYGKGVRADNPKDASALAGKYKGDRPLLRARINAALAVLKQNPRVNPKRIAAIGYCFGGTTVLELARSGAEIAGVVSFHGGLNTPTPADATNIKTKILACHGADDPFVPEAEVLAFQKEMRDAKVDWQLSSYGNAVHSFTDKNAGHDNSKGSAFNAAADARSWREMEQFLAEVLR